MITDPILVARAAAELDRALRGARLVDIGRLDDGRVALRFGGVRAGGAQTLAVDLFGSPPLVTLEDEEPAVGPEPGWMRPAGTALRNLRLREVRARAGDRVIVLAFGAASRFGVASAAQVVLELVPRYGNVVVLRDQLVVAAAKQFSAAQNEARSVQQGQRYTPPPLREGPATATRLPRLLAASVAAESGADALRGRDMRCSDQGAADRLNREVLDEAQAAAASTEPAYVYVDDGGRIAAVHVVPLAQFRNLRMRRAPSLLAVFAQVRSEAQAAGRDDVVARRRAALATRIARRITATGGELGALERRIADAGERENLRAAGDALYTHLAEIPAGAHSFVPPTNPRLTVALDPLLDPKENARRYYARYRKATDAVAHLERRQAALSARKAALEDFAFALEGADAVTLAEIEQDLDLLEGRTVQRRAARNGRKREPLRIDRPSGARILVGRSPRENVEVTFRLARPDDLWFHARGVPGAHVILQPPPGRPPSDDDLTAAADVAAAHSRARDSGRVEIDYTERKYVRKQRDAAPGLVWYTNARTLLGRVREHP
ncbi:MAG: DUF814 domain-containing protein [Candidatus Eremiobacteraeota bacterium]|nr:DUF814 domain-containing protein [Candidatus Eremiobacteraeota bacterium]